MIFQTKCVLHVVLSTKARKKNGRGRPARRSARPQKIDSLFARWNHFFNRLLIYYLFVLNYRADVHCVIGHNRVYLNNLTLMFHPVENIIISFRFTL